MTEASSAVEIYQIDVSFSCVCPVIDHEFRHNIVIVALDPCGSADYFDNVMTKFIVNNLSLIHI